MRSALLFTLLALLPVTVTPAFAEADSACASRFAALKEQSFRNFHDALHLERPIGSEIERAVQSGYAVKTTGGAPLLSAWKRWGDLHESQQRILERLSTLTLPERQHYLQLVKSTPAKTVPGERYRKFLLLGLYDQESWRELAQEARGAGELGRMAGEYLPMVSEKMPDSLRQEMLSVLGAHYEALGKEKPGANALAPKRLVDLYFKHLLKAKAIIEAALAKGENPAEAYDAYVAAVHEHIFGEGYYTSEQSLRSMVLLQISLRKKMAKGLVGESGEEPVIFIGGSLPNGRATLRESDMDVSTNFEFPSEAKKDLEHTVDAYVKKLDPETKFHMAFKNLSPSFWQKVHPVVFRVKPEGLDMMVFDANGKFKTYRID